MYVYVPYTQGSFPFSDDSITPLFLKRITAKRCFCGSPSAAKKRDLCFSRQET